MYVYFFDEYVKLISHLVQLSGLCPIWDLSCVLKHLDWRSSWHTLCIWLVYFQCESIDDLSKHLIVRNSCHRWRILMASLQCGSFHGFSKPRDIKRSFHIFALEWLLPCVPSSSTLKFWKYVKLLSHFEHLNGFSPVCDLLCCFSFPDS